MALFAPLLAFVGRQVGRIVQMAFGWATILLFGRVPQRKQLLLAGVALGSILWVVTLLGVLFPGVGAFLIALVPAPDFINKTWIRLTMLVLAVALPVSVGAGGLFLMNLRIGRAASAARRSRSCVAIRTPPSCRW